MKARIQRSSVLILVLLLVGVGITILSISLLVGLDYLVHTDLYRYGLQFTYDWAGPYWTYFRLTLVLLAVAGATTGITMIYSLLRFRSGEIERVRFVSSFLLIAAIVMTGVSAVLLIQLDHLVHTDLYRYGLQFTYDWAGPYWTYFRLTLALQSAAITLEGVPIALFLAGYHTGESQRLLSTRLSYKLNAKRVRVALGRVLATRGVRLYLATVTGVFVTALAVLTIPGSGHPLVAIRHGLGAIFVLWLPGYSFVRAVFPTDRSFKTLSKRLDGAERVALSIGMSLALVPIVGLLLDYSPWGIHLMPIVVSLLVLTLVFATAAFIREWQIGTRTAIEQEAT